MKLMSVVLFACMIVTGCKEGPGSGAATQGSSGSSVLKINGSTTVNLPAAEATNPVVVSSELVNRLLEQGLTNNPALRAAASRVRAADANVGSVHNRMRPISCIYNCCKCIYIVGNKKPA